MKLYMCPGSSSLAPHIALHELDLPHVIVDIDLRQGGGNTPEYLAKNPLGAVPLLELEDGQTLAEVSAILQCLADQKPEAGLAPRWGHPERYQLLQWLSFVSSEVHKCFYQMFFGRLMVSQEPAQKELINFFRDRLQTRWQILEKRLQTTGGTLLESGFSVADIYLYVTLTWWLRYLKLPLTDYPNVLAFVEKTETRPGVQAALNHEGLAAVAL